jgi:hypothetical protein
MIRGGHIIAVLIAALALKVALRRKAKDRPDEQSNSLRGCFPSRAGAAVHPQSGGATHFEHVPDIEDDGFITLNRNAFGFPANHGRH